MHYCSGRTSDSTILSDIQRSTVPEEALTCSDCWKRVCQVRGRNFSSVSADDWRELCGRRGYLKERENPRGF